MLRSSRFFNQQMRLLDEPSLRKRLTVLTGSEVFKSVPANELRLLASMFEEKRYGSGDVICRAGDEAKEVFVVTEGAVEVWLPESRKAVDVVGARGVVGEYGMFTDARRNATLIASGTTILLSLDYHRFERFLLSFSESTIQLFRLTVQRFLAQQQVLKTKESIRNTVVGDSRV
jgi:CRP-like cAMP-binding protein